MATALTDPLAFEDSFFPSQVEPLQSSLTLASVNKT